MNIVNGSGPKVVVGNKKDTKSSTSTRKISCSKENSALGRDRKAPKGVGASKPLNRDNMRERFSSNISTESVEEKKASVY